jgi:hypothetical protein
MQPDTSLCVFTVLIGPWAPRFQYLAVLAFCEVTPVIAPLWAGPSSGGLVACIELMTL